MDRLRRATRRHRGLLGLLVGLFLAVQCLVAAHACEPLRLPAAAGNVAASWAAADALPDALDAAHHGCAAAAGEADDGGALCQAHCQPTDQLGSDAPVVSPPAQGAPGLAVMPAPPPTLPPTTALRATTLAPDAAAPPGWPPLYIVHLVLRP